MVEAVGDDGVVFAEQGFEQAAIGIEAGGEEDGVVLAEIAGDRLLELAVKVERAADEADRGHAEAVGVERGCGGGDDLGMIGEAEIIVGAEVDHLPAVLEPDAAALRGGDLALALHQPGGVDVAQGLGQVVEKTGLHEAILQDGRNSAITDTKSIWGGICLAGAAVDAS